MDKNKVLVFADPNSIHTKKWLDGWRKLGYNYVLSGLSNINYDNKLIFKSNININGGNGKEFLKNIFYFKNVLKNENPNIINAHYLTSYGLISALIKRRKDKLVLFLPGTDIMQTMDKNFIYLIMAKFVFSKSNLIISVSNTMTKKIIKYFPYLKNKIITQQYGIDTALLDKFRINQKEIDILTNRGWVKNSNYEILLDVFNKFQNNKKAIIGYDDSSYAKKLKAKYTLLYNSIYKILDYEESISFVAKCKIFVSFTTSDGTPLSLLEAMYLGAIPIVSDLETNHEVINDGINGFIVSINNNDLYEKINYVLSLSEDRLNNIRRINRRLINERFNMKQNFEKMNKYIMREE